MLRRTLPPMLAVLLAACSSNNTITVADAAVEVAEDVPKDTFIGTGNVVFRWTVLGMPPDMGCAAAGATSVRFPANFLQFPQEVTVPCTQGEYRLDNTIAGMIGITPELIDGSGNVIRRYTVETVVMAGQTSMADVRFEPPGSLRVRWTVNGASPTMACGDINAMGVRFSVQRASRTMDSVCPSGPSVTFSNLQVGPTQVTGTIYFNRPDGGQAHDPVQGTATTEVPSGDQGAVTVDFTL